MLLYTKLSTFYYFWIVFPAWIQCFWLKKEGFWLNTFFWFYTRNKYTFIKRNLNTSCINNNQWLVCISCVTMGRKWRGGVLPGFLKSNWKIPWFLKKYSDFVDLWNEFVIVNVVLGVSRRKKLRNASLTSICFACCRLNFYRSAVIPSILYCSKKFPVPHLK